MSRPPQHAVAPSGLGFSGAARRRPRWRLLARLDDLAESRRVQFDSWHFVLSPAAPHHRVDVNVLVMERLPHVPLGIHPTCRGPRSVLTSTRTAYGSCLLVGSGTSWHRIPTLCHPDPRFDWYCFGRCVDHQILLSVREPPSCSIRPKPPSHTRSRPFGAWRTIGERRTDSLSYWLSIEDSTRYSIWRQRRVDDSAGGIGASVHSEHSRPPGSSTQALCKQAQLDEQRQPEP